MISKAPSTSGSMIFDPISWIRKRVSYFIINIQAPQLSPSAVHITDASN